MESKNITLNEHQQQQQQSTSYLTNSSYQADYNNYSSYYNNYYNYYYANTQNYPHNYYYHNTSNLLQQEDQKSINNASYVLSSSPSLLNESESGDSVSTSPKQDQPTTTINYTNYYNVTNSTPHNIHSSYQQHQQQRTPPISSSSSNESSSNGSILSEPSSASSSSTVSSSSKQHSNQRTIKRRSRTQFTKEQIDLLEAIFNKSHYPEVHVVDKLSDRLGLSIERISVWFQNRRAKFKKTKKPSLQDEQSNASLLPSFLTNEYSI